VRKIALKPIIQKPHEDFPLSFTFLVHCINRELTSAAKQGYNSKFISKLCILHFKAFQGYSLSHDELTKDNDFDSVLSAPFSPLDLEPRFSLGKEIQDLLNQILNTHDSQVDSSGLISDLNQLLEFNRMFYGASNQSTEPRTDAKLLGELRECLA